jgi:adenosine deaminase
MQLPGALRRVAKEFAIDNFEEGVHYIEPRFAPQVQYTPPTQCLQLR